MYFNVDKYIHLHINVTCMCDIVPSIGELASSPTIEHNLRVVYMQILIG